MNIKTALISTLLVVGLGLTANCGGGKKEDLSKYSAVCDKVLKCDKLYIKISKNPLVMQKSGGNVKGTCQKQLAGFAKHKSYGQFMPQLMDCLNSATCEKMSFNGCFASVVQKNVQNPTLKK